MSDDETEGEVTEEIFECTIRSFMTRTENECTGAWPSFLKGGISNYQKLFGQSLVSQWGRFKNWHSVKYRGVRRGETSGTPSPGYALDVVIQQLKEKRLGRLKKTWQITVPLLIVMMKRARQLAVAAIWHIYKEQAPRPNYVKVSSFLLYYSVFFYIINYV